MCAMQKIQMGSIAVLSKLSVPITQRHSTYRISHHTRENEEVDEDEIRQCGIKLWQNVLLGFHL